MSFLPYYNVNRAIIKGKGLGHSEVFPGNCLTTCSPPGPVLKHIRLLPSVSLRGRMVRVEPLSKVFWLEAGAYSFTAKPLLVLGPVLKSWSYDWASWSQCNWAQDRLMLMSHCFRKKSCWRGWTGCLKCSGKGSHFLGDELLFLETEVRTLEQRQHFHIHVSLAAAYCKGLQAN